MEKEANCEDKKAVSATEAVIQKKFLDERKVFLWGEVNDESAKDVTEKLIYLELKISA